MLRRFESGLMKIPIAEVCHKEDAGTLLKRVTSQTTSQNSSALGRDNLKVLVGARGFEPPTPWSRILKACFYRVLFITMKATLQAFFHGSASHQ
jgi:hypothetical protein